MRQFFMQPEGQQNRIIMRCFVIEIRILHNMCINGYHKIKKKHTIICIHCVYHLMNTMHFIIVLVFILQWAKFKFR